MNYAINQILAGVTDVANRAYEGSPPEDRLAFEVGMLHSKMREMSFQLFNAVDHIKELEIEIKELEIEIAYKDKK